jgi:hypothetical protein
MLHRAQPFQLASSSSLMGLAAVHLPAYLGRFACDLLTRWEHQLLWMHVQDIEFNPQTLRSYSFPEIDIKSDNVLLDKVVVVVQMHITKSCGHSPSPNKSRGPLGEFKVGFRSRFGRDLDVDLDLDLEPQKRTHGVKFQNITGIAIVETSDHANEQVSPSVMLASDTMKESSGTSPCAQYCLVTRNRKWKYSPSRSINCEKYSRMDRRLGRIISTSASRVFFKCLNETRSDCA